MYEETDWFAISTVIIVIVGVVIGNTNLVIAGGLLSIAGKLS